MTINEPNIVVLMGWVEGASPPGRHMAVADAYCALDNLLTAHVLAADVVSDVQPEAEVTMNTSSSSIYEHDRMLLDLLQLRDAGVDPADVDRYIDERRAIHDAAFPPQHEGEALVRASSPPCLPTAQCANPAAVRAGLGLRGLTRRSAPRRVVGAVHDAARPRGIDTVGFDWYDPVASHAMRVPGRRGPTGGRDWSFGRALWDVEPHPARLAAWCATEAALRPGLPLWIVENGMATQVRDGRAVPRADGLDRPRYVRDTWGRRRRGRRRCARARLSALVARRQLRVGYLADRASASTASTAPIRRTCAGWTPIRTGHDDVTAVMLQQASTDAAVAAIAIEALWAAAACAIALDALLTAVDAFEYGGGSADAALPWRWLAVAAVFLVTVAGLLVRPVRGLRRPGSPLTPDAARL